MSQYTIFGGGPAGLYTAWRLLNSETLSPSDSIEIIEWGNYDYQNNGTGDRLPAGRICSHHYQNNVEQSYIEIGGMRYIEWDDTTKTGHQLVTTTIKALGLDQNSIDFNTTDNPLLFLRGEMMYQESISAETPAPYNTVGNENEAAADVLIGNVSNAITSDNATDRVSQCQFYATGELPPEFQSEVYHPGTLASNIGYWNIMYDQVLNEGYQYAADGGGYTSNVINWNAADAAVYNGEFAPGGTFKTLSSGFSSIFTTMYSKIVEMANAQGVPFTMTKNTRLHSIWDEAGTTQYHTATSNSPNTPSGAAKSTDYAFIAMPPHAIEAVADATRYLPQEANRTNFLNENRVATYLESVIHQPSYKVAMFFDREWWKEDDLPMPLNVDTATNTFGPTITDLPLRQIYYFGDNSPGNVGTPVYGMLASYDDMRYTQFWQELELSVSEQHDTPPSDNLQPLKGGSPATPAMIEMLKIQLARVHYGNDVTTSELIPEPLETVFMNWGHNPFGAGYHAWASHYNICDVMQGIRAPGRLAGLNSSNVFIIGSAFSNDQAWIEGAFCTTESVLKDYLGLPTIATDLDVYPLICGC